MSKQQSSIFYICPDNNSPSGGVKVIYEHVDILNKAGFSAFVVHHEPGFRCSWFENQTPIQSLSTVSLSLDDWLVIPEIYGPELARIGEGLKKVIFNQNVYYTYSGYGLDLKRPVLSYEHPDVRAVMVVSDDSRHYMNYVYPNLPVWQVSNAVDPKPFTARSKKRQIAYMSRKHPEEVEQLLNMLRARGVLEGVQIQALEECAHDHVAEVLAESELFLSFGYPEGFSLPPAEAMAAQCVVVGYHGYGAKEYFDSQVGYPVEAGDLRSFAQNVEHVLTLLEQDDCPELAQKKAKALERVSQRYSPENQTSSVLAAWSNVFNNQEIAS